MSFVAYTVLVLIAVVDSIHGHGMMVDPIGRASRWREDETAPVNTNDNELFCGGMTNTWQNHNGKCGICGDDYALSRPRPHELGGEYGTGEIVKSYVAGTDVSVSAKLTANHKGYFTFEICNIDWQDESEECFRRLKFEDGNDRYYVPSTQADTFTTSIFLPHYMVCTHCVLRWQYTAGNTWGPCGNGTSALGCGPQEIFRSCADVRIREPGLRIFKQNIFDIYP